MLGMVSSKIGRLATAESPVMNDHDHNDQARGAYEKDGRRHAMGRLPSIWGIRAYGWEEQNLAVKGILSGRDVFCYVQALHARAKDKACMLGT